MKQSIRIPMMVLVTLSFARAADTGVWDVENNMVTYAASVDNVLLGAGGTANVNLSQFNNAWAAAQAGGLASEYTLLYAVLTLDGSIHGTINFYNNSASTAYPQLIVTGGSGLSYGDDQTSAEQYPLVTALGAVAPGNSLVNHAVTLAGTSGSVSSPNITEDLVRFLGDGTIATVADFTQVMPQLTIGNDQTGSLNLVGFASVSISYYYDYTMVPEPSSFVLITLGCAVLMGRRRLHQACALSRPSPYRNTPQ